MPRTYLKNRARLLASLPLLLDQPTMIRLLLRARIRMLQRSVVECHSSKEGVGGQAGGGVEAGADLGAGEGEGEGEAPRMLLLGLGVARGGVQAPVRTGGKK